MTRGAIGPSRRAAARVWIAGFAVACAAAVGPHSARAEDDATRSAETRCTVRLLCTNATAYVGEPIEVAVKIWYDELWFKTYGVQRFLTPRDVPVRLEAPWLRELPGTRSLPDRSPPGPGESVTLSVNGDSVDARRAEPIVRDGRSRESLYVERRFVPSTPGFVTFSAPVVRYTYTARFDEDAFGTPIPVGLYETTVEDVPHDVRVLPLPTEGRPSGFTGAVGRGFRLRAEASPLEVACGESLKLTLHIEGEADLAAFDPPALAATASGAFAAFHVRGTLDDRGDPHRTIVYDIAPLRDDVREIPPIDFAVFDTAPPAQYRVVSTSPIPIVVRPSPVRGGVARPVAPVRDPVESGTTWRLWALGALVAATATVLAFVALRARRRAAPIDAAETRARAAFDVLERSLAAGGEPSALFAEFLAAHLRCPPAAVVSRDLAAQLAAADVPRSAAERAAAHLERLVAARYGAPVDAACDPRETLVIAREVRDALASGGAL